MKRLILRLVLISAFIVIIGYFVVPAVHAQVNTGIEFAQQTGLSGQDIRVTIAKIIRIILGFLGIIAIGLIMYAGFLWMTSGGNEEKIAQAKLIMRNGAIGLVIILASFGIVTFILSKLISATGGTGGNNGGQGNVNGQGIGALGNGIIKSVYPEPFSRDVPRNTSIVVTFRELMLAASLCDIVTNDTPAKCAPGAKIKPLSIKIYKTTVGDNPASNLTNASISSLDNKTFVIKPAGPNYLGSPVENINYTVNLTRDVKKADGKDAFNLNDFKWTFEVSNLLDLVSPKIKNINQAGIFPIPDDAADVISGITQAKQATGSVTVSLNPTAYRAPSATIVRLTPPPPPTNASIEGTNRCADGTITMSIISSNGVLKGRLGYTQPGLLPTDVDIINNRVEISPCSLTIVLTPGFAAGNSWRVTVQSEKQADTLTVGSKIYTFVGGASQPSQISVGANPSATAQNITSTINSIHPEVTAMVNNNVVNIKAKIAGTSGNSIELSSSNPVALGISRMQGGADQTTTYSIKDKADQPKNSVIQINFNEAVNPLTIAGTSNEVSEKLRIVNAATTAKPANQACTQDSDCLSYRCNGTCQGDQLAGTFVVSNQYRTVEFISDIKCGINGCGENIYCLPGNSNLKVEVAAASLQSCTTNNDCTFAPYTTCSQGVCQDAASNKNYPTAPAMNGIVDLADNSLDGNRNDNPQGKADVYDENKTPQDNGTRGDNYLWSFWISDRLDLTAPKITGTSVNNNQGSVSLTGAIEIVFSKIMMSSSLSTGAIVLSNGVDEVVHKLINLWSLANDPIGYWVRKEDRDVEPLDGKPDRTSAFLGHGDFNGATLYQSQVGSGVKDIYQNCYKPSSGPGCNANALQPSCCRDQNGNLSPTADLTPDGNCP